MPWTPNPMRLLPLIGPSPVATRLSTPSRSRRTDAHRSSGIATGHAGRDLAYALRKMRRALGRSAISDCRARDWGTVMHRREEITRFRCHVHRIGVESGQRPSEDLYADRQRGMLVNQNEGASAQ